MNLHQHADHLGIPPRTLENVTDALAKAAKKNADKSLARLMLNHGRLTEEARAYVEAYR